MKKIEIEKDLDEFKKNLPDFLKVKKDWWTRFLNKVDNTLLYFSKKVILYLVKKEKYKTSKYKVMLFLQKISIVLFFITIFVLTPIGILLKTQEVNLALILKNEAIMMLAYSLLLFFEWMAFTALEKKSALYEPLFLMQKHPAIYKAVKMRTELEIIVGKDIRFMLIKSKFLILIPFYGLILLLAFMNTLGLEDSFIIYFMFSHFLLTLNDYIECIFDFDKPDGEKRKVKEGVTALVQKIFEELSRVAKPLQKPL